MNANTEITVPTGTTVQVVSTPGYQADVDAITNITAVPSILELICRTTGMGFAAVARVTDERWIACGVRDEIQFGLQPGGELKLDTTICNEVRQSREAVVIDHVAEDAGWRAHRAAALYGFQSCISMPIILADGSFFGTLCAIDPRPARPITSETISMFRLFASLIAFHLDAAQRLATAEASLLGERKTAELREQFIAVLGHDLRNPVTAISAGAEILLRTPLNAKATKIVGLMQSSVTRISGLIDDVLDFARGRLGNGLTLTRNTDEPLAPVLQQVIAELHAAWPDRVIDAQIVISRPVNCDRARIGQLFSNLLGNALTYGAANQPVEVRAATTADSFELTVTNAGKRIPLATQERLFQPYSRGAVSPDQQGLGLGLYIAAEIARAHGGNVGAISTDERTCFTFRMPLA